jgi:hypothetical protein
MHFLEAITPYFLKHMIIKKLSATKCESGNVEMQWNNIKKCVVDTMSNLVGKIERKARKLWITQEIISTMDECQ